MKQLFTLIIMTFSLATIAQSYMPIPESNATWIQGAFLYSSLGHEHVTITQPLTFGPDSTILGLDYHGLTGHQIVEWIDGWGSQQNYQTGQYSIPSDTLFVRQDVATKKVFAWHQNRDTLLYDFDLTIGQVYPETMTNLNYPNLLVMGQDSVLLLDGMYHKRWALGTEPADSGYITLIEGVGANVGFSLPLYPLFEQTGAILCFKDNSNQVYENWGVNALIAPKYSELCEMNVSTEELELHENSLKIWPNPTSSMLFVSHDFGVSSIHIVDMQGRIMLEENNPTDETFSVNIENLNAGSYLLYVKSQEGINYVRNVTVH